MNERYELTIERIRGIVKEETVPVLYREYFQCVAEFILEIDAIRKRLQDKPRCTLEEWQEENKSINTKIRAIAVIIFFILPHKFRNA